MNKNNFKTTVNNVNIIVAECPKHLITEKKEVILMAENIEKLIANGDLVLSFSLPEAENFACHLLRLCSSIS